GARCLDPRKRPSVGLAVVTAQWVQLGGGTTLVSSEEGAWIQPPQAATLALRGSMPRSLPGTLGTTRHLLDGAIAAGERSVPACEPRALTERGWATLLVDQWYTAHHGVALLRAAIRHYESMHRPELAGFARRKLEE